MNTYTQQLEEQNRRMLKTGTDIIEVYSKEAMQNGMKIIQLESQLLSANTLLEEVNGIVSILKNYASNVDESFQSKVFLLQARIDSHLTNQPLEYA